MPKPKSPARAAGAADPEAPPKRNAEKLIPAYRVNFLSWLFFSWQTPLMRLGYSRPLEYEDMYQLPDSLSADANCKLVTEQWNHEVERVRRINDDARAKAEANPTPEKDGAATKPPTIAPSLVRVIWGAYGTPWLVAGIFNATNIACQVSSPVVLQLLLTYLQGEELHAKHPNAALPPSAPSWAGGAYGYILVLGIFALQFLSTLSNSLMFFLTMRVGMTLRGGMVATVYAKALRLSAKARAAEFNAGRVTNIISTDTARLDFMMPQAHTLWAAPVQLVIVLCLLLRLVGIATLGGFALMAIAIPTTSAVMRKLSALRKQNQLLTDQRVKLMNEVLQGIKVIKLLGWEVAITDAVMVLRDKELALIKRLVVWRAWITGISQVIPAIAAIIVFATYYAMGNTLTPAIVFSALALFNQLRLPLMMIPASLSFLVDAKVAMDRISSLLTAEELSDQPEWLEDGPNALVVDGAEFEWEDNLPQIHNAHLTVPKGSLVAVVGAVGSGKSSLLSGIVGEMKRTKGHVQVSGRVGYCPQQAWIQNATLKDNILFGLPFDAARYARAVRLASLERDFKQLPDGEMTEIGEKGITLSGGQKARINIARAIYFDADILLLDDPLSAVDAHVGSHLFNTTITTELKGKTRVLVTHALHFVPQCDYVVYLKDGKIVEQGTFDDLMAADGAFAEQMRNFGGLTSSSGSDESSDEEESTTEANSVAHLVAKKVVDVTDDDAHEGDSSGDSVVRLSRNGTTKSKPAKTAGKLMQAEERSTGSVEWEVYKSYMRAMGGVGGVSLILGVLILSQVFRVGNDLWLSAWTSGWQNLSQNVYLGVYFGWGVGQAASNVLSAMQFAFGGLRAARAMHREAVLRVTRSPMSFFDTTPLGRVINRFSKDQDQMDNTLMDSIRMFLGTLSMTLSTFVIMCVASPLFIAPLVPLLVIYYYVQLFYRHTSIELKRLDSLSRSPLYAQFTESLNGIVTIRAFREQDRFMHVNRDFIDNNNRCYFETVCAQRWLSIRIETIGNFLVFFAGLFGVLSRGSSSTALIGLSMSYALQVTGALNWCIRQMAEAEMQMNSVERIAYYAEQLETEAPPVTDVRPPTSQWPEQGEVVMDNVTMAYRQGLDPVLRDVSLRIPPGSKCGIVGRTGAGKSSLIVALFRLVELTAGTISIDGVDISKLGLSDLRTHLSIIPQDPVLFSGTVRSNLDRFNQADDATLWSCLERAGLKDYVQAQPEGLDAYVAENGESLSVGQRQLMCLARAMVRSTTVLIMDEATASVDLPTDALIQQAIRRDFAGSTVLTIAHRLNTIIDYDLIVVMDAGRVAEVGSPAELLANPESQFSSLIDETGPANAALLRRLAIEKRLELDVSIPAAK
ncbi:hypothetical protein AMAG_01463 [Allomyces macrogynus ATCC 38327]|uniref:Uncharacterized protein n=1 Tax=Allomyces macrogynus (strain ATCC 38327) TaxID=578462 RepID=A0A0L0RYV9_ALLM3|nr:hypothetical protein AMAG_01463 [Allomyces macrogynus ATCC 38327]|eukprot:KNE55572.1 hypothetical protein AMAG_01463 [Allomyces macrogynus ATCC 38327]